MLGVGAIAGIAFRILANLDQIMALWAKIEPMIRSATGLSSDVKELVQKVIPGLLDKKAMPSNPLALGESEEGTGLYSAQWLQESLNTLMGSNLTVDGDIGEKTREVVRAYQTSRGLEVDGWPGAGTQARILADLEALPKAKAA